MKQTQRSFRKRIRFLLFNILFSWTFIGVLGEHLIHNLDICVSQVWAAHTSQIKSPDSSLFTKMTFEAQGIELLNFLQHHSKTLNYSFFLDRRVDPTTTLFCSSLNEPFIIALERILYENDLSVCVLNESILYVGPKESAGEVLLLIGLKTDGIGLENATKQIVDRLTSHIQFRIRPFSEPRDIFANYSQQTRIKLSGFDKTPFDLWRDSFFQDISSGTLLTILGIGFNVDYLYDAELKSLKPVSILRNAIVSRKYLKASVDAIDINAYSDCYYEDSVVDNPDLIKITGPFYSLAKIEYQIFKNSYTESDNSSPESKTAKKTITNKRIIISGEVSNKSLQDLFHYLETTVDLVCILDKSLESEGVTLNSRISCKFNNANQKQIASIIAKEINAKGEIDGNKIIFIKKTTK